MQSPSDQRKAVRTLRFQGNIAMDSVFEGLPDDLEAIILKHAAKGFTPAINRRILRDAAALLDALAEPISLVTGKAAQRAARLPQEALGE